MHHQAGTLLGNSNTVFHPGSHYWNYYNGALALTHWGRVMHKCVNKLNNGLLPDRRQAIIWTNAGILLIGPLRTNFSEIFIGIHTIFIQENALQNVVWKMSAILFRHQCVKSNHCNTYKHNALIDLAYRSVGWNYLCGDLWKLISNFSPHFTAKVIIYPCLNLS